MLRLQGANPAGNALMTGIAPQLQPAVKAGALTLVSANAVKGLNVMLWVIKLFVLVRLALLGIPGQNADNWNVLKILIAQLEDLVSTTNVLIPVLVSVVSMLSVMPTDISPYVHASWDMKEIQSLNVN